mmetsp:Transcript_8785/g.25549  ORF Transcript_8785/g.25549 Transcript_8785/m.25549 type:complete len:114 (-) Transcript_8785:130-471(-)
MGSNGRNRAVFVASGIFSFCFIIAILYVSTDRQPKSVLNALGSSEEYASNHALRVAQSVDIVHNDTGLLITGKNDEPGEDILKEVEKAEEEQQAEMNTEMGFAQGGDEPGDER